MSEGEFVKMIIIEDYIEEILFLESFSLLEKNLEVKKGKILKSYPQYGYELRRVRLSPEGTKPTYMICSYTIPKGDWIGDEEAAKFLCKKRGIAPIKASPDHCVCSIGYSEKEGKWYGWSHRSIFGFKIGDVVKKGDCAAEYLPIGFKAKTIEDTEKMARAHAKSVS